MESDAARAMSVRLVVDYEVNATEWWDALRASGEGLSASAWHIRHRMLHEVPAVDEVAVPGFVANEFIEWASTLPGWDADHPAVFVASDAPGPRYLTGSRSEIEEGDWIVAMFESDPGDWGQIKEIDGDNVTVAWKASQTTTTQPLAIIARCEAYRDMATAQVAYDTWVSPDGGEDTDTDDGESS